MNGRVSPPSILSAHNFPTASCTHCPSKHVSGLQKLCLLLFPESTHFKLYLSKLSCFCPDVNDLALFFPLLTPLSRLIYFNFVFMSLISIIEAPISPLIAQIGVYPGQSKMCLQTLFSLLCILQRISLSQATTDDANRRDNRTMLFQYALPISNLLHVLAIKEYIMLPSHF